MDEPVVGISRDVAPAAQLVGHVAVPGDKSISHRAVLIGALSDGAHRISGFGRSADTEATLDAVRSLGVHAEDVDVDTVRVNGVGLRGLAEPGKAVDCRNAGTLMRLLAGVLAGQRGTFELVGDDSLRARPMERVAEPLRRMGATVQTTGGHAPLTVTGGPLEPITYELPVASAQVKSAILLAGLLAGRGETTVVEPIPTRDHTERMLAAAGARVERRARSVSVWPAASLVLGDVDVPGDFSSAAPLIVAATLVPGSELHLHGVGLNPRRTGLLEVLERMGAHVTVYDRRVVGGEPVGSIEVRAAELVATDVGPGEVASAIDELPLFALAAAGARGRSRLRGAEELRAKESDRIDAVVEGLRGVGAHIEGAADGFVVRGVPTRLRGGRISSRGDHRIAMLGGVAGLVSSEGVTVDDAAAVDVSFPGFFDVVDRLRAPAARRFVGSEPT